MGHWTERLKGTIWKYPVNLTPSHWDNSSLTYLQLLLRLLIPHLLFICFPWYWLTIDSVILLYTMELQLCLLKVFPFFLKRAVPSKFKTWGNIYTISPTPTPTALLPSRSRKFRLSLIGVLHKQDSLECSSFHNALSNCHLVGKFINPPLHFEIRLPDLR